MRTALTKENAASPLPPDDLPALPAPILHALRALVDHIPEKAVLEYAQTHPDLAQGGFKFTERNVPTFRTRLKARIKSLPDLDDVLRQLLYAAGIGQPILLVLSEEALEAGLEPLMALHGRETVLATALLDDRAGIRKLARSLIQATNPPPLLSPEQASATLRQLFAPFLDKFAQPLLPQEPTPETSPAAPTAQASASCENCETLRRRQARELQQWQGARERLDARIQSAEQENRDLQTRLDAERTRQTETARKLRLAEKSAGEAEAGSEQLIRAAAEKRLQEWRASLLGRWLAAPLELEQALPPLPGKLTELSVRTQQLLEQQAAHDRHFGNRRALTQQLATFENIDRELREAELHALDPLPELRSARAELDEELGRLRTLLSGDRPGSPVMEPLLAALQRARTAEDLEALDTFLEQARDLGFFAPAQAALFHERRQDWFARQLAAHGPIAGVIRQAPRAAADLRFLQALDENQPFLLLLDGHNILHSMLLDLPELAENGEPGRRAQQRLVQEVIRLLAPAPRCEAQVVYDSPTRSEERPAPNVQVVFSGGTGAHRADQAILDYLGFCRRSRNDLPRSVVTDDSGLATEARALGASRIDLQAWIALLRKRTARKA